MSQMLAGIMTVSPIGWRNTSAPATINPDTDYDNVTDGDEIYLLGTDPLNPDSDGNGYNDYDDFYYSQYGYYPWDGPTSDPDPGPEIPPVWIFTDAYLPNATAGQEYPLCSLRQRMATQTTSGRCIPRAASPQACPGKAYPPAYPSLVPPQKPGLGPL
jgi:hypothetical protein